MICKEAYICIKCHQYGCTCDGAYYCEECEGYICPNCNHEHKK